MEINKNIYNNIENRTENLNMYNDLSAEEYAFEAMAKKDARRTEEKNEFMNLKNDLSAQDYAFEAMIAKSKTEMENRDRLMYKSIDTSEKYYNGKDINDYNKTFDDDRLINLVKMMIETKGTKTKVDIELPKSLDDIPQSTLSQISEINHMYQKGLISSDVAVELITDLFESNGIKERYEKYANDVYLQKLRKLYELLEIMYQDLLNALNMGRITQEEFMQKYSKFRNLETNALSEIVATDEILHTHSK